MTDETANEKATSPGTQASEAHLGLRADRLADLALDLARAERARRVVRRVLLAAFAAVLVGYAAALAVGAARFGRKELGRSLGHTASGLTACAAEEGARAVEKLLPRAVGELRGALLRAWPKILEKADEEAERLVADSRKEASRRISGDMEGLEPRVEVLIADLFPDPAYDPRARAAISRALCRALSRAAAERIAGDVEGGREDASAAFSRVAAIAGRGDHRRKARDRLKDVLGRFLAAYRPGCPRSAAGRCRLPDASAGPDVSGDDIPSDVSDDADGGAE